MISARSFSRRYGSFWDTAMPLADRAVREVNAHSIAFARPIAGKAERRDLVGELVTHCLSALNSESNISPTELQRGFCRYKSFTDVGEGAAPPSKEEVDEALFLAERVLAALTAAGVGGTMTVHPKISGCGFLDTGSADILIGTTLCEVKSVRRPFRAVDLRQLMSYAALAHEEGLYPITRLCVINPVKGWIYVKGVIELCQQIAGCAPSQLYASIINFVADADDNEQAPLIR